MPSKPLMDVTDNLGWKTFFHKKKLLQFFSPIDELWIFCSFYTIKFEFD